MAFIAAASTRSLTAVQTDKAGNASPASPALVGTSGVDTITSTSGNDFMVGGNGADTFVFCAPFGNDVIAGFAAAGGGHDIIDFHANSTLKSFASVQSHTTQVGSDSVISDGSGNTLTLNNVTKASLTAVDFTFV
jgi:Ca2+-binding RTX toxin-like protein